MKVQLMHRDRDFDLERALPAHHAQLTQDLELDTLCAAMAADDPLLFDVSRRALLSSLTDPGAITYRQQVMSDCLHNPSPVRELYALAGEALVAEKRVWGGLSRDSPGTVLRFSANKMGVLLDYLRRLRRLTDEHQHRFLSPGITRLCAMIAAELDDAFLDQVDRHLSELTSKRGVLASARLTAGNTGSGYTLRRRREQGFVDRMLDRSGYTFTVAERDESGHRALGRLEDRAVNLAANALAQAVEHVLSFLTMLRIEVGFYVACLNLRDRLAAHQLPVSFPVALAPHEIALSARALYDPCLAVTVGSRVVGNDLDADGRTMVMITGANQGGKSTFLRSVGLAQLMIQCGMFVAAEWLRANVCDGVFTHYKREEDDTMQSGKLDEELARMSDIADQITSGSMLLCNESFAATNEREGSQIAREVLDALRDEGIKVLHVTHLFDLADSFHRRGLDTILFLRAQRGADGQRPYTLVEGKPLPTSYGEDSYRKIFGRRPQDPAAGQRDLHRS